MEDAFVHVVLRIFASHILKNFSIAWVTRQAQVLHHKFIPGVVGELDVKGLSLLISNVYGWLHLSMGFYIQCLFVPNNDIFFLLKYSCESEGGIENGLYQKHCAMTY